MGKQDIEKDPPDILAPLLTCLSDMQSQVGVLHEEVHQIFDLLHHIAPRFGLGLAFARHSLVGSNLKLLSVPAATDLRLLIQVGSASPSEIAEVFTELSKLFALVGGRGLLFRVDAHDTAIARMVETYGLRQ